MFKNMEANSRKKKKLKELKISTSEEWDLIVGASKGRDFKF